MTTRYATAFALLAELYLKRGGAPLNTLPGVAEFTINKQWRANLSGHKTAVDGVPAFSAVLYCNDWPAGVIDPFGGALIGVSEDELIEALEAELEATHA